MQEYAEIIGYKHTEKGTELLVIVPDKKIGKKLGKFGKSGSVKALLKLDDNRKITIEQLRKAHVMMGEIGTYLGYTMDWFKALMKSWYVELYGDLEDGFSMASMSVDQARRFINIIIEFAFDMNIPLKYEEMPSIVEIDGFLYMCLLKRKCTLCGDDADRHHVDAIGMGRDRTKYDDSDHTKIALCRRHHNEAHNTGWDTFSGKYHVYGILFDD